MKTRATMTIGAAACVATLASPALAQNTPPGEPGANINIQVPRPPPANQPLVTNVPKPEYSVEGGAGLLGYINGAGKVGPAWNVRVTAEFTPRIAAEGNYVGAANARSDEAGTLVYNSFDGGFRYNILRADEAPVQPYAVIGLGYAGWSGPGGSPAALVIPGTIGVERMLTEHIKIGARFNLRPSFGEDLSRGVERNPQGGSAWSMLVGAGGAF